MLLLALTVAFSSVAQTEIKKEYYPNGNIKSETPYEDGKKNGIKKEYYESGKIYWETPYLNDKSNGISKGYYQSGLLHVEMTYVDGKESGIRKVYFENGNLEMEINNSTGGIKKFYEKGGVHFEYLNESEFIHFKGKEYAADGTLIAGCITGDCINGYGTYKWTSGEKYTGDFKNYNREGKGTYTNAKGTVFTGWWKNDKWFDYGCLSGDCENGIGTRISGETSYTGPFKNGKADGEGTETEKNGTTYKGQWKKGHRKGEGTQTNPEGITLTGDWDYSNLVGPGIETLPNGYYKKAKFKDYNCCGKNEKFYTKDNVEISYTDYNTKKDSILGIVRKSEPKVTSGKEWEADGYTIIYSDDNSYGNFTGKARIYKSVTYYQTLTWNQFKRQVIESRSVLLAYEGDIVNGKKEGFGKEDEKVTTKDGIVYHVWYVGEFKNGLRNGKGKMQSRTSVYDVGTYQDGVFIGR